MVHNVYSHAFWFTMCMSVCWALIDGGLYHCIVACTLLANSTGRSTVTLPAPLSHCGMAMYEAELHSKK